tara:strand:+ start:20646 stop:20846 length:201 start_codon:yes stop_codon:yes gene_type:complete
MSIKSATEIDQYVGSRMRVRRIEIGLSQEALGNQVGAAFQHVQKYERGRSLVTVNWVGQLAPATPT